MLINYFQMLKGWVWEMINVKIKTQGMAYIDQVECGPYNELYEKL